MKAERNVDRLSATVSNIPDDVFAAYLDTAEQFVRDFIAAQTG